MTPTPFHAGELAAQAKAGVATPRGAGIRDRMPDQHRDFFALLPFLLVAVADRDGAPLATLLTSAPGFAASPDPRTLAIAARAAASDPAAPYLTAGAKVGLLGIELPTRRRNRANGRIARAGADGLAVAVEQSFGNCAQYIQTREIVATAEPVDTAERFNGLDEAARRLVEAADTFFVATANSAGDLDISHRGGRPGFVRADGDVLTVPDFKGNRFFNTFGNLLQEPRAALLVPDFASGDLLQLQGKADVDWDAGAEAARFEGAQRLWRFKVVRGWYRRAALPWRWRLVEVAPTTAATGVWRR